MHPRFARLALALAFLAPTSLQAAASPPCLDRAHAPDGCLESAAPFGDGFTLPVYRAYPLGQGADVRRAVIVVHGTLRNADDYFDNMVAAATAAGVQTTTQILAPRFRTADDDGVGDAPVWTEGGWKHGNASHWQGRVSHGSFEVVDALVRQLADRRLYPSLREIVVTGFSAGGQFAHRYAASTSVPDGLGVPVRFIVGSPSSYLYLDARRPSGPDGALETPAVAACPGYDTYPYGLEAPNPYVAAVAPALLVPRFLARDVAYVSGDADEGTDYLDTTCAAMLQGPYRFARAQAYLHDLDAAFPGHRHHFHPVAGIGHDNRAIYGSEVGRALLFPSFVLRSE